MTLWAELCILCLNAADDCNDPGVPPGALRSAGRFRTGAKVTYRCQTGLVLLGAAERVCLESREWSGATPRCQGAGCRIKMTELVTPDDFCFKTNYYCDIITNLTSTLTGQTHEQGKLLYCRMINMLYTSLQARILLTPPALWQQPWQDPLLESWIYKHQTPKRKVGTTWIYYWHFNSVAAQTTSTTNAQSKEE